MKKALFTRKDAQTRLDQIRAFQQELQELQANELLELTDAQQSRVTDYHRALLERLSREFDVDRNAQSRQLSRGMQVASFLGAWSLGASVFFFFYRFWGLLDVPVQVAILLTVPVLTLWLTVWVAGQDDTGYFAKLAAAVAFACFVLDLSMLGQIFNMVSTPNAFLAWSALGFLFAYGLNARLLLVAALVCILVYIAARFGTWSGTYWIEFGERPENFFVAAMLMLIASVLIDHRRYEGFAATYRIVGMLAIFLPILVLANWPQDSYLAGSPEVIKGAYQLLGFGLAAVAVWAGIRRDYADVVNTGVTFFVIFLYTKFYDWWWDIMPKYLFFLVCGLTAILVLLILRRLRRIQTSTLTPAF